MKDFKLDTHPKIKPGFKAPDAYFDSFTDGLMQQLPANKEVKVVPLYKRKPVWLSAAASFIVMLSVGSYFLLKPETQQPDAAAIENYLMYQAGINSYDLSQNLDQQDIKELEQSIVISDDAIEDYITNETLYLNE